MRLTDIPLATRLRAAHQVCRHEVDDEQRLLVMAAALNPSATVYWIAA